MTTPAGATGQVRHELTKLLIRLNKLNHRINQHLTHEELASLRRERLSLNTELFKVSYRLRGQPALSHHELEELQGAGEHGEMLLTFLLSTMDDADQSTSKHALEASERQLRSRKDEVESKLATMPPDQKPRHPTSPDQLAELRRTQADLLLEIERLVNRRDYYLERVLEMKELVRRRKKHRILETIDRIERLMGQAMPMRSLRVLAELLVGQPVSAARVEELVPSSTNDVFLQMVLAHHRSLDPEHEATERILVAILRNYATFRNGLLEDTESFFRSTTFRRNRHLHSIVIFNPAAPTWVLRHILRLPADEFDAAQNLAQGNYPEPGILDVLTEAARITPSINRLRHILDITAVDPVRRVRFERVIAYRDDIGHAKMLSLRPQAG